MMNTDFGILKRDFNTNINCLGDPWWARFSVLLVNLWLTFPYFFLVCTRAQGIPTDLRDARLLTVRLGCRRSEDTFPLLLI